MNMYSLAAKNRPGNIATRSQPATTAAPSAGMVGLLKSSPVPVASAQRGPRGRTPAFSSRASAAPTQSAPGISRSSNQLRSAEDRVMGYGMPHDYSFRSSQLDKEDRSRNFATFLENSVADPGKASENPPGGRGREPALPPSSGAPYRLAKKTPFPEELSQNAALRFYHDPPPQPSGGAASTTTAGHDLNGRPLRPDRIADIAKGRTALLLAKKREYDDRTSSCLEKACDVAVEAALHQAVAEAGRTAGELLPKEKELLFRACRNRKQAVLEVKKRRDRESDERFAECVREMYEILPTIARRHASTKENIGTVYERWRKRTEMEEEVVEFAPRDGNFDWRDATGYAGTAGDDPRGLKVNRFTREGEEEEYSRKY